MRVNRGRDAMAMMLRATVLLGLMPGLALAGCSAADGPPDLTLAQVNTEIPPVRETDPGPPAASPAAREGPKAPGKSAAGTEIFNAEAFYKLLVGELAGRQGDYALSLESYLDVARSTGDPEVAERAVRIAVFARDEERALEAARLWSDTASPNHDARQVYGVLLVRAGKLEQANLVLGGLAAELADTDSGVFGRISSMLAREKSRSNSVAAMQELATQYPDNADAQFALAQLLYRFGELKKALSVVERVIALSPVNDKAVMFKAQVLQRQDKKQAAIETLVTFLEVNPGSHRARMALGRLLVDSKRYDDARKQFERLSKDTPEDPDVAYALGLLYLQTSNLEPAQEQFRKLTSDIERRSTAWFYLGQIAEAREDQPAALEAYRQVDRGDHFLNAQIRAASLIAEGGDIPAARRHLHAQRGRDQAEAIRLYRAEAEMLGREEMLDDALSVYDKSLEEFPSDSGLLYARAMLSVRMDRISSVETDLRAILAREPDNADALNALGYTLADRTERYEEAYELIKRAFALKPDDHYVVDSLGWVLYRLGRYDEAAKHLRKAMQLKPDPEVAAHLGEVLWVMGDQTGARDVWNTALEAQPEDKRLLEVLKRFGL